MNAAQKLNRLGQSIWLDNITRDLITNGTLSRYISQFAVTGLTSNPTIFDHAIKNTSAYDATIRRQCKAGKSRESLFFDLALDDITKAADLFRPVFDRTCGVDGCKRTSRPRESPQRIDQDSGNAGRIDGD
jgi:transaldolase